MQHLRAYPYLCAKAERLFDCGSQGFIGALQRLFRIECFAGLRMVLVKMKYKLLCTEDSCPFGRSAKRFLKAFQRLLLVEIIGRRGLGYGYAVFARGCRREP